MLRSTRHWVEIEMKKVSTIVDVDATIDQLIAETGLRDLGDPTYRDGLDVFVDALDHEADLNDIGRARLLAKFSQPC